MEKIKNAIGNLKKQKVSGSDAIQNETLIHVKEEIEDELRSILNQYWKKEEIPKEQRTGNVVLTFKTKLNNCRHQLQQ